jgi:nickel/cobalt transporter (NicO) family protein
MAIRTRLPIATAGALLACAGRAEPVGAHPHVWIDAVVTFVFEDGQLVGLRHHWKFDEFFGSFVIEEHDDNGDGAFDAAEVSAIRDTAFSNLREYDYFTHVHIDGDKLPLHG